MYYMKLARSVLNRKFSTNSFLCKKIPDSMKGRKKSSQDWLVRQFNDEYVMKAKMENFRYTLLDVLCYLDSQVKNFLEPNNKEVKI